MDVYNSRHCVPVPVIVLVLPMSKSGAQLEIPSTSCWSVHVHRARMARLLFARGATADVPVQLLRSSLGEACHLLYDPWLVAVLELAVVSRNAVSSLFNRRVMVAVHGACQPALNTFIRGK